MNMTVTPAEPPQPMATAMATATIVDLPKRRN